jgi:hypothetical protein
MTGSLLPRAGLNTDAVVDLAHGVIVAAGCRWFASARWQVPAR